MLVKVLKAQKRKPSTGDTKVVKGVEYIRQLKRDSFGSYVMNNGKFTHEWVAKTNGDL